MPTEIKDMVNIEQDIYPRLPIFAQNIACTGWGYNQRRLRFGGEFLTLLAWLEKSQWWSADEIRSYQNEQLQKIVQHAYETVPYYRRVFDRLGLKPGDILEREDLAKLPILTKEDVRQYSDELLSSKFSRKELVFGHTSGTTGKSLSFYLERRAYQFRWAVWWRHRKRFGIEFDMPYASFTGLPAVPLGQNVPPFWRENRAMNQTVFTMHHVVPQKVKAIVERLNRGGFEYYSGYPSILSLLAVMIREQGLEITAPPRAIFTGAENLYEDQRRMLADVFQCVVTDEYGFSEGCGNASRCEKDVFHEDFEYGVLECVDPEPLDNHTYRGKIIATGFSSYATPFIRYEVGDVGVWTEHQCDCGRKSRIMTHVEGRVEDYVVTPEGRKIMRFDYIFKDAHHVKEAQVIQKELGSICLRIVRRSGYTSADEIFLKREVANRVSSKLDVDFEYVDEIEREPTGKFRAVKSFLNK